MKIKNIIVGILASICLLSTAINTKAVTTVAETYIIQFETIKRR